ncbi:hypothetical protein PoHVEF18_000014 [Penicillium ochrochloron]
MPSNYYDQERPTRCLEAVPRQQKKWLSFLTLRFAAVLCQMTVVICFAWAYTEHEKPVAYIDGLGSAWSSINLGTAAYAFLWSTIFLVVVLIFNCRVHPGASITFDCLAFLAQIITVSFYVNEFAEYQHGGYSENTGEAKRLYGVECFGIAMMFLGLIFNLVLMIRASMACHVERKAGKQAIQPKFEDA